MRTFILGLRSGFSKRTGLLGEPSGANDDNTAFGGTGRCLFPAAGIGGRYGLNGIQRRHSLGLGAGSTAAASMASGAAVAGPRYKFGT
jgi:hypothetical protein